MTEYASRRRLGRETKCHLKCRLFLLKFECLTLTLRGSHWHASSAIPLASAQEALQYSVPYVSTQLQAVCAQRVKGASMSNTSFAR